MHHAWIPLIKGFRVYSYTRTTHKITDYIIILCFKINYVLHLFTAEI